jgi:RNA polymerase sigma-70 factor (ECF subfamily)
MIYWSRPLKGICRPLRRSIKQAAVLCTTLKTWVYRITANYAINYAKKNSRTKTVPFEESFGEGAVLNEAQAHIDQEHQGQLVEKLLGELNADQRACVVLRDIQGLSYEEIAQALNININTVRSRLKRSREKLLTLRPMINH